MAQPAVGDLANVLPGLIITVPEVLRTLRAWLRMLSWKVSSE